MWHNTAMLVPKSQLISKADWRTIDSPKLLHSKQIKFVRSSFWENLWRTNLLFGFIWPLDWRTSQPQTYQPQASTMKSKNPRKLAPQKSFKICRHILNGWSHTASFKQARPSNVLFYTNFFWSVKLFYRKFFSTTSNFYVHMKNSTWFHCRWIC